MFLLGMIVSIVSALFESCTRVPSQLPAFWRATWSIARHGWKERSFPFQWKNARSRGYMRSCNLIFISTYSQIYRMTDISSGRMRKGRTRYLERRGKYGAGFREVRGKGFSVEALEGRKFWTERQASWRTRISGFKNRLFYFIVGCTCSVILDN